MKKRETMLSARIATIMPTTANGIRVFYLSPEEPITSLGIDDLGVVHGAC